MSRALYLKEHAKINKYIAPFMCKITNTPPQNFAAYRRRNFVARGAGRELTKE